MRKIKFKLVKDKKLQGIVELAWYEVGGKKYYFDELVKENIQTGDLVSNNQNLDTILQEADKDFEDFYWETGKYNGRDLGIDGYKDFIHSNITKAYEAGCDNGKEIYKKAHKLAMERGKQQTIKKIQDLISKEIVTAQKEGQPTSRLTSLFNKLK